MKHSFIKNISAAFSSAGWLMIGTGLMVWVLKITSTLAEPFSQYAALSTSVGGCFVVMAKILSYLSSKNTDDQHHDQSRG